MYSEIQAAVGFLANFLYNKLPRRKVNLFAEQLANFLVQKFGTHWFPADPQRKSNIRCVRVNVDNQMDPLISVAASCVGLELEDVTKHLPTELTIWVNPGEVSYKVGQSGPLIVLYSARDTSNAVLNRLLSPVGTGRGGAVDATGSGAQLRLSLQEQQEAAAAAQLAKSGGNTTGQTNGNTGGRRVSSGGGHNSKSFNAAPGAPVQSTSTPGNASPTFELSSPNDVKFTVGAFAMTRFGTTKLKSSPAGIDRFKSPKRRHPTGDRFKHE